MEWRLFADLAEAADADVVAVEAGPGDTIGEALQQLLEANPDLAERVLDEDGELGEHVRVLRNDHDPFRREEGADTVLERGDDLALLPPVSGG